MKIFTFITKCPKGTIQSIKNYGSIKALYEDEIILHKGKRLSYDNVCYRLQRYGLIEFDLSMVIKNFLIQKKHSKKVIKK